MNHDKFEEDGIVTCPECKMKASEDAWIYYEGCPGCGWDQDKEDADHAEVAHNDHLIKKAIYGEEY